MRSTLFRLIFCFTAVTVAGVVRVEASIDAIYSIAVSGRNSDGTRATTNRKNNGEHPLQEGDFLGATDSVEGSTDSGFGTAHIALFGTHRDKKALLGAQIGGGASLARLPFAEGGEISAGGNARVGYHEVLTFDGSLSPPVLMHIQGFLKLHGSISASSSKTGSLTLGAASTSVTLTGTGIDSDTTFRTVFQRAGQSQQTVGAENLNIVPFSYFVFPGNLNHVDYVLNVFGNAQVSSALFVDNQAGTASSVFNASFEHTLEWGGITSVTRASTGEPIIDWSVTSESGFDYSQVFPIPEPSVSILLFTAAATLVLRRRRLNRK